MTNKNIGTKIRKVYEKIGKARIKKWNKISMYPLSYYKERTQDNIEFAVEKLIKESEFGRTSVSVHTEFIYEDSIQREREGGLAAIRETGIVSYADNFLKKYLREFGRTSARVQETYDLYHPYNIVLIFEPKPEGGKQK